MPGTKWAGVARRGTNQVAPQERPQGDRGRKRQQPSRDSRREPKELGPPPAWEPEQWIEEPDAEVRPLRKAATKAVARGGKSAKADRPRRTAPADVASDIGTKVPRAHAAKVEQQRSEAAKAF